MPLLCKVESLSLPTLAKQNKPILKKVFYKVKTNADSLLFFFLTWAQVKKFNQFHLKLFSP